MMYTFKRQEAGLYMAHYNNGYKGLIGLSADGTWTGAILRDPADRNTVVAHCTCKTLKQAKALLSDNASHILVEKTNLLTGKAIQVSINTPASADPSTETYHCM